MRWKKFLLSFLLFFAWAVPCLHAFGDWPIYQHDASRSGSTEEVLPSSLQKRWVYRPLVGPEPAWEDPEPVAVEASLPAL